MQFDKGPQAFEAVQELVNGISKDVFSLLAIKRHEMGREEDEYFIGLLTA